jgi:hypothetical protein
LFLDTEKIRNYDLLLLSSERLNFSNKVKPLNKFLTMTDLSNLLNLNYVSLAIVCQADREKKKKIGIEFDYEPPVNKDGKIFVYPLLSLQEEFREYSVIERICGSTFLK